MQISKKETKKEVGHGLDPSSTLVTKSKNQKIGEVLEKKRGPATGFGRFCLTLASTHSAEISW